TVVSFAGRRGGTRIRGTWPATIALPTNARKTDAKRVLIFSTFPKPWQGLAVTRRGQGFRKGEKLGLCRLLVRGVAASFRAGSRREEFLKNCNKSGNKPQKAHRRTQEAQKRECLCLLWAPFCAFCGPSPICWGKLIGQPVSEAESCPQRFGQVF